VLRGGGGKISRAFSGCRLGGGERAVGRVGCGLRKPGRRKRSGPVKGGRTVVEIRRVGGAAWTEGGEDRWGVGGVKGRRGCHTKCYVWGAEGSEERLRKRRGMTDEKGGGKAGRVDWPLGKLGWKELTETSAR